jgi:hypothetical protein
MQKKPLAKEFVSVTLFQGKRHPTEQAKELKKDPIVNKPFLEETHHNLSSLPLLTMTECDTWKKEAKTSTSQSCASLERLTLH